MSSFQQTMVMALGAVLACIGLVLLVTAKVQGATRIKVLGIELEIPVPSLVVLLVGCGLVVLPFFVASPRSPSQPPPTTLGPPPDYAAYQRVSDDTGQISLLVPSAWGSRYGNGWHPRGMPPYDGERIGPGVNAATNAADWFSDSRIPGVFVGASSMAVRKGRYTPERLAAQLVPPGCTSDGQSPYQASANTLTGVEATWKCGTAGLYTLSAWPEDHAYIVIVQIRIVDPRDQTARDKILSSLRIRGAR
jgi:hypothetical protein